MSELHDYSLHLTQQQQQDLEFVFEAQKQAFEKGDMRALEFWGSIAMQINRGVLYVKALENAYRAVGNPLLER